MENKGTFSHKSVLLDECIEALDIRPDGIYVDCTAGGGGHSFEIAKRLDSGRLIAIDQDDEALAAASKRLEPFLDRVTFVKNNFENLGSVCEMLGINEIHGVLADLGVSSYQLDTPERGFSYNHDAALDMRMDPEIAISARDIVNNYSEEELKRVIYDYGEERFSPRIASKIVEARTKKPIETTFELVDIIKSAIPRAARENGPHPAKRTFQAIRIEVNRELDVISPVIDAASKLLAPGGRIAIITFHSLEDRIVKQAYTNLSKGCECPPDFPVCVCGKKPILKHISKKPILPTEKELEENPRSRSAKLRVAQKL